MRRIFQLYCCIFLTQIINNATFAQVPAYVPTDSLKAWYSFTSSANDGSVNGNNCISYGATLTSDRFGNPNNAYYFNGNKAYLSSLNNINITGSQPRSISVWIKWNTNINSVNPGMHGILEWGASCTPSSYCSIEIQKPMGNLVFHGHQNDIITTVGLDSLNWHLVVFTYDGTNAKFYYDGNLISNTTKSFTTNASILKIGYDNNPISEACWGNNEQWNTSFLGKIDDIGIWNRALTPCEIWHLYKAESVPNIITTSICQGTSYQVGSHIYTTAGNYIDTLYTAAGCDSIVKLFLTVYPPPQVSLGPDTTLCYWQTYTLNATYPGATYLWQNGAVSPTFYINSIPGTYWVKVTYAGGCTSSDTVHVGFGPDAKVIKDTILCPGQTLSLNATTPGATYLWDNGSTSPLRTLSAGGTYWVKTTINNYCYRTDTVHLTYSPLPVVNLGHDTTLCYWQSIILSAVNPNCQYVWQDGSTFSNKLINSSGTYWAKAYVNSSCWDSDTVVITFKPSPTIDLGPDTTLCQGQSLNLNAYFPFTTYQWQNGSTLSTYNVSSAGTYWVKVSINAGCYHSDTITVSYAPIPVINLGNDTNLCPGTTYLLKANYPGATYLWQNGSTLPTFNVTQAGTYWVKVSINSSCYTTDTIHITYNANLEIGNDTIVCYGQTLTLNATYPNASAYQWSNGSSNATMLVSPPYTPYVFWVKVNANNCVLSDTISVSYYPAPIVHLGNDTNLCQGETFQLDATNPNSTYTWQDGNTNPTYYVTTAGTYWVLVVNSDNCSAGDTINIAFTASPNVYIGNDTSLCPGQTMTLNATYPNATYLWQDNSTNATLPISQQGTYWVVVSVNNLCTASDTINIIYNQNPVVSLGTNTILCPGQTLTLDATISNGIYLWNDGSTAPTFTATGDGDYEVLVTDTTTHCSTTAKISLECDLEIIIPNIITPNGDGFNDYFVLKNSEYWIIELQIYDRWGVKVHEDGNYQNKWEGKYKGNSLAESTYFYNIKAKNKKTGKDKYYHGSLTILR